MPNRIAAACRSGLRQREKDEDDEERSHHGPIQSTVAPPPDCIQARERRLKRFTPLRQGASEYLQTTRDIAQCSRHDIGSDRGQPGDIQSRRPLATASRRCASRVGAASAIAARMTGSGARS